uniref:PDZ domain-containing protein n=1 Tax=Photinus pyralis TaxID=7054 RepID=A0A1Y1L169_PHOPY
MKMRTSFHSEKLLSAFPFSINCFLFQSQILERVQSDRVAVTKPEEDRRRRTIIVEKKNGSYGFTLQSYGIHFKKEQEIEMITYVDYVDYDGPAYRAGMREGDVILSINGTDMEKADHKTLVNFIKNCDSRMRMVVLFEDCVRKVELHMRYIQLQRILQSKVNELEKLCIRERQILEGKWKTHSLPARKKASHPPSDPVDPGTPTQSTYAYCRPTVSTEDVAKMQQKQHPPTVMLAYQYLDRRYSYVLQPSTTSSGEYLLTFEPPRYQDHFIVKTPCDNPQQQSKGNQTNNGSGKCRKSAETCHGYAGHLCNPCLQANNNGDNTSLEAYDLASPCCNPNCVPNTRRRSRNQKDGRKAESKTGETQTEPQLKPRPHSQSSQTHITNPPQPQTRRYLQFGTGIVSQCSLHSCTSSEISAVAPTTTGESTASYTTSLSTDTLYWDGSGDVSSRHQTIKPIYQHRYPPVNPEGDTIYIQYNSSKPKSWDNLATKAIGGYGFGYGYLDTTKCGSGKTQNRSYSYSSSKSPQMNNSQYFRICRDVHAGPSTYNACNVQKRFIQPTKSTESLLSVPKYSGEVLSDSCECLDPVSPGPDTVEGRFFQSPRQSVISPTDPNVGYYSARRTSRGDSSQRNMSVPSSEATRL